jgi:hypothetical protein
MMAHPGADAAAGGWFGVLRAARDAQPLVATLSEALQPLAALGLRVADVNRYMQGRRQSMQDVLVREGISGEYGVECALTVHSYTVEDPFAAWGGPIYRLINAEMHSPRRGGGAGSGGLSARLQACMPYIELARQVPPHG